MCRDRKLLRRKEGHLTTDSSDSSGEEIAAWAPVVGHYAVAIPDEQEAVVEFKYKDVSFVSR